MKKYFILQISFMLMFVSCARQLKDMNIDMTTKGIVGTTVIIEDDTTYKKYKADTLFFKRLESVTDFNKGTIIMSKVIDADGNIVINAEPGSYVVVAARYANGDGWDVVVFDEKILKYSLVELKAGDTKIIPVTYVVAKLGNVLGLPTDMQKKHANVIAEKTGYTMHRYVYGSLNETMYQNKDDQKKANDKKEDKPKEVEEFK
jgi:hypothetical protein